MEEVRLFVERGGEVVYPIMLVIFLLWFYLFERIFYIFFIHPARRAQAIAEWTSRSERRSWHARQIHQDLVCALDFGLQSGFSTVRMLIVICPLLGLLGTVTGMIEVFDVMVQFGGGSPKPMAAGISKAILSTVAGMVGAISGLLAQYILLKVVDKEKQRCHTSLSFD
ncbi:MotA/TolQ/ExbB proton channel family protein [Oceanobacter mangrovi]|uniref:MotA/TolQ/ExbB proton channel family protein n=1 Tax=Oceanobacter mangrovi TaxID=2862510 RepID=UPI001C8E9628|nr:MotA/TolQ/ExbB proton channel family protein [Oceanobacter mangrovi]